MGSLKQLIHPGPMVALSIITICSVTTIVLIFEQHNWGPFDSNSTHGDFLPFVLSLSLFLLWPFLTLRNYFKAVFLGPCLVPLEWRPPFSEQEIYLQYCAKCNGFKPPRSHHCRKYTSINFYTILRIFFQMQKMRYKNGSPLVSCASSKKIYIHLLFLISSPWINDCVGALNLPNFIYFLFFAPIGCIHALLYNLPFVIAIFRIAWTHKVSDDTGYKLLTFPSWFLMIILITFALSLAVIISVGGLFFVQFKQMLKNKTGIERFICKNAEKIRQKEGFESHPPFVFPYDISNWKNCCQIMSHTFKDDGIYLNWPLKQGCTTFDLTNEEIFQKKHRFANASLYEAFVPYDGNLMPIKQFGWKMACPPLLCFTPQLLVEPGDTVLVSRSLGQWLYGDLKSTNTKCYASDDDMPSGWFPKHCVRAIEKHD